MATIVGFANPEQAALRRNLRDRRAGVDAHAWGVSHARELVAHLQQLLSDLRARKSIFLNLPPHRAATYFLLPFLLVAVWYVDTILTGAMIEYLVGTALGGIAKTHPGLVLVLRLLLPAMLIGLELKVAAMSAHAKERAEDHLDGWGRYWIFTAAAWTLALALPLCALGQYHATKSFLPESARLSLLLFQVFTSLIGHVLVLFGQVLLLESFAWAHFQGKSHWFNFRIRRNDGLARRELQATSASFRGFAADVNRHNTLFPATPYVPEPFDLIVLAILRELFGPDVVQQHPPPPGPAPQPTPPERPTNGGAAGAPQPAPGGHVDGDAEYLRTILARRMRDEDGEIRR